MIKQLILNFLPKTILLAGDYYSSIVNIKDEIPGANFVKDVGLGFMHTIAIAN